MNLLNNPYRFTNKEQILKIYGLLEKTGYNLLRDNNELIHFSASSLVFIDESGIFIRHPTLNKVLLPAGHVELKETPMETAIREFKEETGFSVKYDNDNPKLIDLNLIAIPYNLKKNEASHYHIDFRYYFELDSKKQEENELEILILDRCQAPQEFMKYFDLLK